MLATQEFRIASGDEGIELYVRNKFPAAAASFDASRIVLFVHGASYPSSAYFDLPLDGVSWMDFIAGHGYDVYLVDIRGYGRSSRPREMDEAPERNPPLVDTEVASRDVAAAIEFIRRRRGASGLSLIGWSWGTGLVGRHAVRHPAEVHKLVLYAPVWIRTTPSLLAPPGPLGAYRLITEEAIRDRWLTGVPEADRAQLVPPAWMADATAAALASDPWGASQAPPVLRAPNGCIQDGRQHQSAGTTYFRAEDIRCPTLLTVGEWDRDTPPYMAQQLFRDLTAAPRKELREIPGATHTMLLERNRMQLFHAVQDFLGD